MTQTLMFVRVPSEGRSQTVAVVLVALFFTNCTATPVSGPASPPPLPSSAVSSSPSQASRATAEQSIDELADALESSSWGKIRDLIAPTGWSAGFSGAEGTRRMAPDEAVQWLRARASNDKLVVNVDRRPVLSSGGRPYVWSLWTDFNAYMTTPNRTPRQRVQLLFNRVGDLWYWNLAVFGTPAP